MKNIIMIYVTCADAKEAQCIAAALLEKSLIACANILPQHKAVYMWNGKVTQADETAMILKTKKDILWCLLFYLFQFLPLFICCYPQKQTSTT